MPVIKREMAGADRPKDRGGRTNHPAVAMLNLPTLWTVFVVNFLSVGLIWVYVARSYPKLVAARFWTASAFTGASGAAPRIPARVFRAHATRGMANSVLARRVHQFKTTTRFPRAP